MPGTPAQTNALDAIWTIRSSRTPEATNRGSNVLFADGSVKFIKDSVNQRTWFALGTKAGGEIISSDSYRSA